jgi:hypothetical protein
VQQEVVIVRVRVLAEEQAQAVEVGREAREQTPRPRRPVRRAERASEMRDTPADERVGDREEDGVLLGAGS